MATKRQSFTRPVIEWLRHIFINNDDYVKCPTCSSEVLKVELIKGDSICCPICLEVIDEIFNVDGEKST